MPTTQPLLSQVDELPSPPSLPQRADGPQDPPDRPGDALPVRGPSLSTEVVGMFERLATNPAVDVAKLEKLIEMQERILRHHAKAQFDADFSLMQGELPVITERGEIEVDGKVRSQYARYEDIIEIVRPILQKHGFALRHRNQDLPDGKLRIIGVLSHRAGHAEEDGFDCPPDISGKKNNIQAIGSTRSYGQRYTTVSLLNIISRGADDDGRRGGSPASAEIVAPDGFERWYDDLTAVADNGTQALEAMWTPKDAKSIAYKNHLVKTNRAKWEKLKTRAAEVTALAKASS